jgi:hypothetical protein
MKNKLISRINKIEDSLFNTHLWGVPIYWVIMLVLVTIGTIVTITMQ